MLSLKIRVRDLGWKVNIYFIVYKNNQPKLELIIPAWPTSMLTRFEVQAAMDTIRERYDI